MDRDIEVMYSADIPRNLFEYSQNPYTKAR